MSHPYMDYCKDIVEHKITDTKSRMHHGIFINDTEHSLPARCYLVTKDIIEPLKFRDKLIIKDETWRVKSTRDLKNGMTCILFL